MKSRFIILLILFSSIKVYAQNEANLDEYKHFRIHLDNRTNKHLKDIPRQILERYCKGNIKAYFPKAIYNEVNFNDFLYHFRWNEPLFNESILCGDDYCSNPSFEQLFNSFNVYLDYYSKVIFDSKTSVKVNKTEFVQLVYSVEYAGMIYNFLGPLFRLDEISKLIFVKIEQNDSQTQNLKTVFDIGRFYSVQIANPEIKPNENNKKNFDYNEN
ncbi:MAG: hypothetical protein HUU47_06290 [Bacteroidetes bacterium]|nr:hypothetical protein [Bacteroidota bacterium]